jgi:hypothetical protein
MVVVGHEGFDLLFQIARQVVVLQQDAVLQRDVSRDRRWVLA